MATLVFVDTYAGWKGSLPEKERRARIAHAREMFAAPTQEFDPTLPGLLADDPPAETVALLEEMATDVRPESMKTQLSVLAETDQRDLLPGIEVPALLVWGEQDARSPLTAQRRASARTSDPGRDARVDPQRRSRQQSRTARAVQRGRARVLPHPLPALDLRARDASPGALTNGGRPARRDTGIVSTRNVELVREALEAQNRGDIEWLIDHSAPDIEIRGPGVAGEPVLYTGAAGIREYFRDMAESWQSFEAIPVDVRELGDRVVAIIHRRLRGRGSGIDIEDKLGIVYELRNGVAIRIRGYRNVVEALAEAEPDG